MNIDEVKKQYPHPTAILDRETDNQYCVAGSLFKYLNREIEIERPGFPTSQELSSLLLELNPSLKEKKEALKLSWHIIYSNDSHEFEEAWESLNKAVNTR